MSEKNGSGLLVIVLSFLALLLVFAVVATVTGFRFGKPESSRVKKKTEKPSEPDGIAKRDGALQVLELLTALDELNNG